MFCWGESGSILGSVARIWFAHPSKDSYSSTCCCDELKSSKRKHAVVAQLVEHHLAKVDVASSSLVNRSTKAPRFASGLFRCLQKFWQVLVLGCGAGWESCDLSRGDRLGDCPAVWLSGCREAVQEEKTFKKIWDAKRAGEGVKLLSEPPRNPRGGALKGENRPQNPLFEEI